MFEDWLEAGQRWDQSKLVIQMRQVKTHGRRGSRKWMVRSELVLKYSSESLADEIIACKENLDDTARAACVRPHPDCPTNPDLTQYLVFDAESEYDQSDTVLESLFSASSTCDRKKGNKRKRSSSSASSESSSDSSSTSSGSSSDDKKKKKKKGKKSKKDKKGKKSKKGDKKKKSKADKEKAKQKQAEKDAKEKAKDAEKKKQKTRQDAKKARNLRSRCIIFLSGYYNTPKILFKLTVHNYASCTLLHVWVGPSR